MGISCVFFKIMSISAMVNRYFSSSQRRSFEGLFVFKPEPFLVQDGPLVYNPYIYIYT